MGADNRRLALSLSLERHKGPKLGYASNGAGFWAHLKHFALPYMQFMYNEYGRGGVQASRGLGAGG